MINRNIEKKLEEWRLSDSRKPLLLRGARQVGKTTVVNQFALKYKQYIYLNLEKNEDASLFEKDINFNLLVKSIFFLKNKNFQEKDTLIFIDEIQMVPKVINLLRYFYEDYPRFHIIAAGSLLETLLNEKVSIPVGRVQFLVMRPVSFEEYLAAYNETAALEQYQKPIIDHYAHDKMLQLFHSYCLIGGMPEIQANFIKNRNLTKLKPIYEGLIESYIIDVEKYAKNTTMTNVIRHVIMSFNSEVGNRIKFQHFGNSNYGSREVTEALRVLEKALLIQLVYPLTSSLLPVLPEKKKSPRLQMIDTGLFNYMAKIQKEMIGDYKLDAVFNGKVIEHIVGQELMANEYSVLEYLMFWVREKKDSSSEIDFIKIFEGYIFPLEVKAGANGTLKSLQNFMNECNHHWAIRLYSGKFSIDTLSTNNGKPFFLLNLPYYLAGRIEHYLEWFMTNYPLSRAIS